MPGSSLPACLSVCLCPVAGEGSVLVLCQPVSQCLWLSWYTTLTDDTLSPWTIANSESHGIYVNMNSADGLVYW